MTNKADGAKLVSDNDVKRARLKYAEYLGLEISTYARYPQAMRAVLEDFAANWIEQHAPSTNGDSVLECLKEFACAPPKYLSKEWFELVDRSVTAISDATPPAPVAPMGEARTAHKLKDRGD